MLLIILLLIDLDVLEGRVDRLSVGRLVVLGSPGLLRSLAELFVQV